jgi:hypothetical protein
MFLEADDAGFVGFWAAQGVLTQLDPLIKRDKVDLNVFFPTAIEALKLVDGKIWAYPHKAFMARCGLVYNAALFQQNGLPLPADDWTYDDIAQTARRLTKRSGTAGRSCSRRPPRDLVHGALAGGASLHDLGEQRLRDLQRPERVFQLVHAALPGDFPPLRSLDALPHNLPAQLTSFVGREHERGADSLSCSTLVRPGQIAVEAGDLHRGSALLRERLQASARIENRESLTGGLAACVHLAAAGGDWRGALRLASAAGSLRGGPTVGGPASAVRAQARAREAFDRRVAAIRGTLDEDADACAWAEGQALSWDAALEAAASACQTAARYADGAGREVSGGEHPGGISRRAGASRRRRSDQRLGVSLSCSVRLL